MGGRRCTTNQDGYMGSGGRRNLHLHGQCQQRKKHTGARAILLHTRIRQLHLDVIQLPNVQRWPYEHDV
jgi:hypothetical protein